MDGGVAMPTVRYRNASRRTVPVSLTVMNVAEKAVLVPWLDFEGAARRAERRPQEALCNCSRSTRTRRWSPTVLARLRACSSPASTRLAPTLLARWVVRASDHRGLPERTCRCARAHSGARGRAVRARRCPGPREARGGAREARSGRPEAGCRGDDGARSAQRPRERRRPPTAGLVRPSDVVRGDRSSRDPVGTPPGFDEDGGSQREAARLRARTRTCLRAICVDSIMSRLPFGRPQIFRNRGPQVFRNHQAQRCKRRDWPLDARANRADGTSAGAACSCTAGEPCGFDGDILPLHIPADDHDAVAGRVMPKGSASVPEGVPNGPNSCDGTVVNGIW